MRHTLIPLAAMFALASIAAPLAASPAFPTRAGRVVVDDAHVLTAAQDAELSVRVRRYNEATHHQFVIVTLPTLQGYDVKTYGYQLLRHWKLGDPKTNDGVILLLSTDPRKVRIEVGYGLEPVLTDVRSGVILRTRVIPKLKAGDIAGALADGADAIMAATGGAPAEPGSNTPSTSAQQAEIAADVLAVEKAAFATDPGSSAQTEPPAATATWVDFALAVGAVLFIFGLLWLLAGYLHRRDLAAGRTDKGAGFGSNSGAALFGSSGFGTSPSASSSSSFTSSSSDSGGGGSAGGGGADSSW